MSDQPEKNILVDRGIPMGPPEKTLTVRIGDSTEVEAPTGNPYGTSASGASGRNSGWTMGFGGSGGRGEGSIWESLTMKLENKQNLLTLRGE